MRRKASIGDAVWLSVGITMSYRISCTEKASSLLLIPMRNTLKHAHNSRRHFLLMIDNRFFKNHHKRLVTEAAIKATLCGLAVGFTLNFLLALAAWFFDFGSLWLAIGCGLGIGILTGILFYFLKFRPTPEETARRVDRLGLKERLVTMMELQNDDSYIASLQRSNAIEHLSYVQNRKIKLRFSKALAAITLVTFFLGASMTTVLALSEILPDWQDINPEDPYENFIAVSYVVEEGGEIIGEADQLIAPGSDTTPVVAVAEEGWMFVGWDDGNKNPERQEFEVTEDLVFTAIFEELGEGIESSGGDASDEPSDGEEGDKAPDAPPNENASSSDGKPGDSGGESSGEGSNGKPSGDTSSDGESEDGGDGEGGQGSSGKWHDSNQFYDGNTYYRDYLDMYYEMAQDIFAADGSIPPEFIEFFESYFNSI